MNIIVAHCRNRGIGINNNLPWRLAGDMAFFKKTTIGNKQNCVIMGRKTWESIPKKPLPSRENIILSNKLRQGDVENANVFNTMHDLKHYVKNIKYENVWVIGGEQIYREFLNYGYVKRIYATEINYDYECDVFFPDFSNDFILEWETSEKVEKGIPYKHRIFVNKNYTNDNVFLFEKESV